MSDTRDWIESLEGDDALLALCFHYLNHNVPVSYVKHPESPQGASDKKEWDKLVNALMQRLNIR